MKIKLLILVFLLPVLPVVLISQSGAFSPRIANYDIDVTLDVENKTLDAHQKLIWKNTSPDTIRDMYFHLYYNAFRNTESTFFHGEGVPQYLDYGLDDNCRWAWSEIRNISDKAGNDLTGTLQYLAPDDGNEKDMTVAKIELAEGVLPGDSIELSMEWKARIPRVMPRTGYNRDYYFFAQWFPKVAVYEPAGMRYAETGGWNCHQYHSWGEFYADFGNYNVRMTVPEGYTVASSGQLRDTLHKADRVEWYFQAEDVIDFAWGTSPHFIMKEDSFKETTIKFYAYPYKEHMADRYFSTLKFGMKYLEERLGRYPYPTLTLIDAPYHGIFTGGMEYPTLITSISFCFFPIGFKAPETLAIHEFIHQYFMQMVATNETEDPWMDEGITTYYEGRIMDAMWVDDNSLMDLPFLQMSNSQYNRAEFFNFHNPRIAPNTFRSWEFEQGGYGVISYNKTALWLKTLEGLLGTHAIDNIMQQYFNEWKFRHPDKYDFTDIVNRYVKTRFASVYPEGMDWFFEQFLYGTGTCDYSVGAINIYAPEPQRGFLGSLDSCVVIPARSQMYRSEVVLYRLGEIFLPQEIEVVFEDGSRERHAWEGKARSHSIWFEGDKKIVEATIDPERKIYIDSNFLNNSRSVKVQRSLLGRLKASTLTIMQHLLETLSLVA